MTQTTGLIPDELLANVKKYDDLLERALKAAGYRVTRIVRDRLQVCAREGEPEAVVVKLPQRAL